MLSSSLDDEDELLPLPFVEEAETVYLAVAVDLSPLASVYVITYSTVPLAAGVNETMYLSFNDSGSSYS